MEISMITIETGLWHIERHLIEKYGFSIAEADMHPLKWYVYTGRASCQFIHKLFEAKQFMIARKLHEGGSVDEVIDRVKSYIGMGE